LEVLAPRICVVEEIFYHNINGNPTLLEQTNFPFQNYTKSTICILMDFYLVLSMRVPLDLMVVV
jgi:hypothetical protein